MFIKGPGLISGYLDPKFDIGAFTDDGWFNTGDMGRVEADGYVWITGRTKDLLIPTDVIHDTLAHFRRVMEASRSGMVRRSFQAMQQASTMAS